MGEPALDISAPPPGPVAASSEATGSSENGTGGVVVRPELSPWHPGHSPRVVEEPESSHLLYWGIAGLVVVLAGGVAYFFAT